MIILWAKSRSHKHSFIHNTWFKNPTKINTLRFILKVVGFSLLLIALLDFRGPEEKIESNIPDQKTIIIIDSSASMLAEDVRPNRYQKSILMARHFIKKAFGHRVAVVLFSDTQKRLVPFTDDLDLLDARVAGLNVLKNYDGGSNISQAIKESLGYFRVAKGDGRKIGGNILVFTDSEGHDEKIDFDLPAEISLAIVGVGTLKGTRIPKRDRYNTFRGYKKYKGKEIYTKLNETWLRSLSKKVETYKYWIANSYSIPTEEVLRFFNRNFNKKINKGSATVKPVKAHLILVPALVLLTISFALYPLKAFTISIICFVSLAGFSSRDVAADDSEQKEIKLSSATESLLAAHKEGKLKKENVVKLAEMLVRDGDYSRANFLYEELGDDISNRAKNNYAVSLIKNKRPDEALRMLSDIQYTNQLVKPQDSEFEKEVRQNLLLALKEKEKQKKQDKKKKDQEKKEKEKGKDKNKDQKEESQDQESKSSDKKNKDGKEGKNKKDKESDKNKKENKKDNEKDDKKESKKDKEESKDDSNEKSQKKQSLAERQKEIEKKKKMIKIPGLIKQIMSDDRNLQKRYLDTSTKKPQERTKKDW